MREATAARGSSRLASAALLVAVAGCGTDSDSRRRRRGHAGCGGFIPPDIPMQESLGEMEGQVNILAWPGYAEDGSTDQTVDWVTPFEEADRLPGQRQVLRHLRRGGPADEDRRVRRGLGLRDASLRLIAAGDAAPVNTDLLTNYADIVAFLKDRDWNSVDGQMYGVPHGWGANLLMYNTEAVSPAPTSWRAVFDDASAVRRQGDGVRLADLHRRRRAVPDEHPAGPRDREPLRARRGPAGRGGGPAQGAAGERLGVLVGLPQGDPGLQDR